MVKVLEKKYPLGSLPNQKTAGRYMDNFEKCNIDILAETIVNDMQYFGLVCSSTYEVRTGKTVKTTQFGEYYTDSVNRQHGLNLTFDTRNIVFNSADLIKRALELPRYSCLILDEDDQVDEHYFSQLSKDLRKFFRKSGQLNLMILLVTPNFFALKKNYAISRSNFLIDVKFGKGTKFERGYFSFYDFDQKRKLYLLGKKTENYLAASSSFSGRFLDGLGVDEKEYKKLKYNDLVRADEKDEIPMDEKSIKRRLFKQVYDSLGRDVTISQLSKAFKVSQRTGERYLQIERANATDTPTNYINT